MKLTMMKIFSLMAAGVLLLSSCVKNEEGEFNGSGSTFIKLPQAAEEKVAVALDLAPGMFDVVLLDVRRDAPNNAELQKALTVKIKNDTSLVGAYNRAHGTHYEPLPTNTYTIDAGNPYSGNINVGEWTVTFAPGEHAKPILIKVEPTKFDLTKQYALGFKVVDAGGVKISSALNEAVVEVGAKNKYDGVYSVESGSVIRYLSPGVPANDALSGNVAGNPDVVLVTAGPNTVEFTGPGGPVGLQWAAGNNSGVAGINGLKATVDPATNLVTMTSVQNGTLVNMPNTVNKYDPATKTFTLNFYWNPAAATREYHVVLKYKGPR